MTTTQKADPPKIKIPVGQIWLNLVATAGKLRNLGLDETAICDGLKKFVAVNCDDPNYPEAKIKSIASAAVNPDPNLKDLVPIEFDFTPRPPVTDPEILEGYIRRALKKRGPLMKTQLQSLVRHDPGIFDNVWAAMLRSGDLEYAGRNRYDKEVFQLADGMELTLYQQSLVQKIRVLQEHTRLTGFRTTRSVNDIKASLDAEDLAAVCKVLNDDGAAVRRAMQAERQQ